MNLQLKANTYSEITDKNLLELVQIAINKKEVSINCYKLLLAKECSGQNRSMINEIIADEIKHQRALKSIYFNACKKHAVIETMETYVKSEYIAANKDMLFSEITGMEIFKSLYQMIKSATIRDILFDIITDDQIHSGKLSLIIFSAL